MGNVTHEQANLLLRLYELRREPRLRQARNWFIGSFFAATFDEVVQKYPPGSEANTSLRMVTSYWDMVASIVNRGLIDEEFFFENSGELWLVYDRLRATFPSTRAAMKNPKNYANLEEVGKRYEAWRERHAPGANAALRERMEQMRKALAART